MSINFDGIDKAITEALHETIDYAADLAQENLSAERYFWPRVTRRKNGQVVSSPRDARDENTLYNSQYKIKRKSSGVVGYDADHAIAVHEGEPELDRPERPWLRLVAEEQGHDIAENFANNLKRRLS